MAASTWALAWLSASPSDLPVRRSRGMLECPPVTVGSSGSLPVPAVIRPALADHLATFTASQPDALVFASSTGAPLRDGNLRRRGVPANQGGSRSPALTGTLMVFPGGASGHCHASLYRHEGW